jgi:hypothetical protein
VVSDRHGKRVGKTRETVTTAGTVGDMDDSSVADYQALDGVDIVGDVHGHAGKLRRLLHRLGYRERDGIWSRRDRVVVFVGDLIDRGPEQLETLRIVRPMVDAGAAIAVMGNHEYNAIAWATVDPERPGEHLRTRSGDKGTRNRRQHAAFLAAVGEDTSSHLHTVDWFRTLPLWLDLGFARVAHACWDRETMVRLAPSLRPDRTLTDDVLVASARRERSEYLDIETLLKGPEITLPSTVWYHDKDGNPRRRARYAWWAGARTSWDDVAVLPGGMSVPAGEPLPEAPVGTYDDDVPVFFGHYWFTGAPRLLGKNIVCVDYSAGNGGPLVAYRHDRGEPLDAARFVVEA